MNPQRFSPIFPTTTGRSGLTTIPRARAGMRGFTLVEIFVAIGVIAILAALLVPMASRQVESGRSAKCLGNLRNLAMVMSQFRTDRNQILWNRAAPADGGEGDIAPTRAFYRAGVIGSAKELRCPAATTSAQGAWKTGGTGTQDYMDNVANQFVSYAVNDIAFYQNFPYMMSSTPIKTYWHFSGHESRTPIFMDGTFFQLNDNTWRNDRRFERLALRHQDHCNVLFLDGHVESMNREAVKLIDPYGGTNPRWWSDFGPK
jgi:prepilin-type processing-associated H-X9-DG protein/prepilin-type N-terminal cleavage/methylation domain-containing protein